MGHGAGVRRRLTSPMADVFWFEFEFFLLMYETGEFEQEQ